MRKPRVPRQVGTKPALLKAVRCSRERGHCPDGFYTSDLLRHRLGVSDTDIKSWTQMGFLQSDRLNNGGYALYSEETVQLLINRINDGSLKKAVDLIAVSNESWDMKPEFSGTDVTRVFRLIAEGLTLAQIQIATELHPQVLRAIRREYDDFEEMVTIPKPILDQMNTLPLPGTFPLRSATDILEVMKAAAADRTCNECPEKRPCSDKCVTCLRKRFATATLAEAAASRSNGARAPAPDTRIVPPSTAAAPAAPPVAVEGGEAPSAHQGS